MNNEYLKKRTEQALFKQQKQIQLATFGLGLAGGVAAGAGAGLIGTGIYNSARIARTPIPEEDDVKADRFNKAFENYQQAPPEEKDQYREEFENSGKEWTDVLNDRNERAGIVNPIPFIAGGAALGGLAHGARKFVRGRK